MPQDRPTAADLLDVVAQFLEHQVIASTGGGLRFRARVAANTLGIVAREIQHGESHLRDEIRVLSGALGRPEPAASTLQNLTNRALLLNHELCERIRAGAADANPTRAQLIDRLRFVVESKLKVANPEYLEADRKLRAGDT